jgi:transposase
MAHGGWKNTHRRFCRWRDKGIWSELLAQLVDEPDYEWVMIDATHVKVHPHAAGGAGRQSRDGRDKKGATARSIWPLMRMV